MDRNWYLDVNRFAVHTPGAHSFMKFMAVYAVGLFAVLLLLAWWFARSSSHATRGVAAAVWTGLGTLSALGLNQLIAHAVRRPRPFVTLRGVEVLVAKAHDYSFPSDHAVTAGAVTAGLWIVAFYGPTVLRRVALASTVLAIAVAFARVYVGVHYPTDVLAGLVIGAALVGIGWLLLRGVLIRLTSRIAHVSLLRPLVIAHGRGPFGAAL